MNRKLTTLGVAVFTTTALLASPAAVLASKQRTIRVDCSKGQSIQKALEATADELTVEIHGTCREDLVLRRDNVALLGGGGDSALVGSLFLEGASGILVADLTIRDSERWGLRAHGAGLVMKNVTVRDNASTGIAILLSSTAVLENVTAEGNFDGITAWVSSSLELEGEIRANGNRRCGMIVSSGSGLEATGPGADLGARLIANDNGVCGLAVQVASGAQFGEVRASGNGLAGVAVFGSFLQGGRLESDGSLVGLWVLETATLESTVEARENSFAGLLAEVGSNLVLVPLPGEGSSITDNQGFGLLVDASHADLDRVDLRRNGTGVSVDGGSLRLRNSALLENGLDAELVFGSRATFGGGNEVGSVVCDPTVLARGEPGCPAETSLSSPARVLDRRARWGPLPLDPPFPLRMQ